MRRDNEGGKRDRGHDNEVLFISKPIDITSRPHFHSHWISNAQKISSFGSVIGLPKYFA